MKQALKTDREFLSLSIPLQHEQQMELERSLMRDGCKEPVIVWNGVIIDGHKRYRICEDECIDYDIEEMNFTSRAEAISWVCQKRIPEQSKLSNAYRYLVGRFYTVQKQIYHGAQKFPENSEIIKPETVSGRVSVAVGRDLNLNRATVESYGMLANEMDKIADKTWPLFEAILSGSVRMTIKEIHNSAALSERKLKELSKTKWHMDDIRDKSEKIRNRSKKENTAESTMEIPLSVKIKEMPMYDPDMELRGLTLTIPAWITAIGRVKNKSSQATDIAKAQLSQSLIELKDKIDALLAVLN